MKELKKIYGAFETADKVVAKAVTTKSTTPTLKSVVNNIL